MFETTNVEQAGMVEQRKERCILESDGVQRRTLQGVGTSSKSSTIYGMVVVERAREKEGFLLPASPHTLTPPPSAWRPLLLLKSAASGSIFELAIVPVPCPSTEIRLIAASMALAEVVAAAPDSAHHTGDPVRTMGGGFKGDLPQEHVSDDKNGDATQFKRLDGAAEAANAGYSIPVLASYDGGVGCDTRHVFSGMLAENGQSMYYAPGYEFPQQSPYCSQPQGAYMSNMGSGTTGYCGPQYGPYYQQVPPGLMQYYPAEQEVTKAGAKKLNVKDCTQNAKAKPGVPGKPGYQAGHKSILPDASNHWGLYPATANGAFYGSTMGYDCYVPQQWHSSMRGFQPIPSPQNIGAHGNGAPPLPGSGPGRFQNFPRVHSAPNMSGRVLKGCSVKGGSTGSNWRAKDVSKGQNKGDGPVNSALPEACGDSFLKPSVIESKVLPVQEGGEVRNHSSLIPEQLCSSVNRSDYNKDDFQVSYEAAKFFIIKSYSEDDVHKSIKYSVWSSTPNGNKRLDEAYRKAQEKSEAPSTLCPVFFFFSVNCSGQFCGVAEMVGPVDFGKNMDFWLQGKWNGCLPVKWHIIKDVPNGHFRHIILSNNDNKPVTHSRDTQEVHFHQGLEMLKIFKFFPTRTSLLDDFAFYDGRQRVLQERKSRQQLRQQVVRQIKERASEKANIVVDVSSESGKENSRSPNSMERTSNGAAAVPNQVKENGGCVEVDSEKGTVDRSIEVGSVKPTADSIIHKVAELKVDNDTDSNKTAKSCPKDENIQESVSTSYKQQEKVSKTNAREIVSDEKESSSKAKTAEVSSGGDQNKPKSANGESATNAGKDDASRMASASSVRNVVVRALLTPTRPLFQLGSKSQSFCSLGVQS
ncbi:hypothetical protein GOP47_0028576 [Adiantum capillus-veneris]|nr:hypothetical protein GOP47_0028576 [Adiantum capillus-veneris]